RGYDGSALLSHSQRSSSASLKSDATQPRHEQRARAPDGASLKSEAVSSQARKPVCPPQEGAELPTGAGCCSAAQAKPDEAGLASNGSWSRSQRRASSVPWTFRQVRRTLG